jgi:hypothetical protein
MVVIGAGFLARHHEAEVSHFTDARTGITSHGLDTDCHDNEIVSHMHALPGESHADVCSLTAALHQPVTCTKTVPLVTQLLVIERATAPPLAIHAQTPLLLSAPKTSPPRVV